MFKLTCMECQTEHVLNLDSNGWIENGSITIRTDTEAFVTLKCNHCENELIEKND